MYDGFDDSSTFMSREVAEVFANHYPSKVKIEQDKIWKRIEENRTKRGREEKGREENVKEKKRGEKNSQRATVLNNVAYNEWEWWGL